MRDILVKDLMRKHPVTLISPDASLREVAEHMAVMDCGALPVGRDKDLLGIITDRDIVTRALSKGKDPRELKAGDYMTPGVFVCKEFDTVREAAEIMRRHQVSRLIVVNDENRLSGIISFGFILRHEATPEEMAEIVTHAVQRHEDSPNNAV